jgi:hypothetical protein
LIVLAQVLKDLPPLQNLDEWWSRLAARAALAFGKSPFCFCCCVG